MPYKNIEERRQHCREYYRTHKKESKDYRKKNKEKIKNQQKHYHLRNKQYLVKQNKEWMKNHKKERKEYMKRYRLIHKKELLIYSKNYRLKNIKIINFNKKQRIHRDIKFKILCNLRTRIYLVLKKNIKSETTIKLIGCSVDKLKNHLKSKFKKGMTWNNYGKWHIDHIIPCASFDLSKSSEQKQCFNWQNLQPLWAKENLIKQDKI
jgi:hypothetical protein